MEVPGWTVAYGATARVSVPKAGQPVQSGSRSEEESSRQSRRGGKVHMGNNGQ